jgi:hypothetical protein
MSSDNNLQEMEAGTKQSKTAVNAGAKAADAMDTSVAGSYEDLGGRTPDYYRPDDDSAKLKEPSGSLKQVKDVVNKGAKAADPMPKGMKEEEDLSDEEVVAEEETTEEEVVTEEEITEEEVVEEEIVEYDMEEDVNALLQGEELSEEFQEKAKTIFEAAINSKVAAIQKEMEEEFAAALAEEQEKIAEEFATVRESLAERIDSYLEYVADEWMTENALAVEAGLKTEMTE